MGTGMIHEDLRREKAIAIGSSRSFGLVFCALFTLIGLLPLAHGAEPRAWSLGLALVMLILAVFAPSVLRPLNVAWSRFGLLLNRIVSPIVMALVFYGAVTPMGILVRRFANSSLKLHRDPSSTSYWIARNPPGPAPDTLKNQF